MGKKEVVESAEEAFDIGGNLVHIVSHVSQCHGNYCGRKELFLNY